MQEEVVADGGVKAGVMQADSCWRWEEVGAGDAEDGGDVRTGVGLGPVNLAEDCDMDVRFE